VGGEVMARRRKDYRHREEGSFVGLLNNVLGLKGIVSLVFAMAM
jgi:hypothetical protein